jgi:peptidoglycan/LPS O-acetylase OafA/YrhL
MSWQARAKKERHPVRNFYLRRLFRILPMFYLAIAFYLLLDGVGPRYWAPDGLRWWFVPLTALCLHAFHPETINSVVPGGWSIGVEMTFYLLLPLVFRYFKTLASLLGLLAGSWLVALFARAQLVALLSPSYPPDQQYLLGPFFYLTFLGQLPVFALGLLTYHACKLPRGVRRALGGLGVVAFLVAKLTIRYESRLGQLLTEHIVVSVAFACFALLLSAWPKSFLVNRPVITFGRLSYSMYLVHFAVIEVLQRWLLPASQPASDLGFAGMYALVVVVASLLAKATDTLVERRGIALGKRLIDRLEERAKLPDANWVRS